MVSCCDKEETPNVAAPEGIYIINEGNFNFGNGDVSVYNPTTKTITNEVFKSANSYFPGDVAQSMFVKDSVGFMVVNNSEKIEVVKIPSFKYLRTISIPASSPRYFLPVNDSIAYVSELYAKKIWVVNYISGNVVSSIAASGWTEKMFLLNGSVFVQQRTVSTDASTLSKLLVVNPLTNTIVNSKDFLKQDINSMETDATGNIWLAMDEDTVTDIKSSLLCFNQALNLLKALPHNSYGHHLSQLCMDKSFGRMIYADKDVYSLHVSDTALPSAAFVLKGSKNIYALGVHEQTGDVYLSDALDFVQRSRIYRYDKFGNEIHSFTAGIISGNFTFNE